MSLFAPRQKKIVTYVCLDYSRVVDAVQLRCRRARSLKYRVEKGRSACCTSARATRTFAASGTPARPRCGCSIRPRGCSRARCAKGRWSSWAAAKTARPRTQDQGGDEGDPRQVRARRPRVEQLAKVRGLTPPQYGTLNEWTRARRRAFANAAGNGGQGLGSNGQGLGSGGGMAINVDNLEDTTFEVTLGLTEEQEAELEAAANPKKAQPEWLKGSVYVDDEQTETNEANDDETKEETEEDRLKKNEEAIRRSGSGRTSRRSRARRRRRGGGRRAPGGGGGGGGNRTRPRMRSSTRRWTWRTPPRTTRSGMTSRRTGRTLRRTRLIGTTSY